MVKSVKFFKQTMKYAVQQSQKENSVTGQQEAANTQIKGLKFMQSFYLPQCQMLFCKKE